MLSPGNNRNDNHDNNDIRRRTVMISPPTSTTDTTISSRPTSASRTNSIVIPFNTNDDGGQQIISPKNNNNRSIITPTRTIRLTGAEETQRRNNSNSRNGSRNGRDNNILLSVLSNRPRSNPHTRTPMRYESPLNFNEFLRPLQQSQQQTQAQEHHNTVILEVQQQRSNKQNTPSQRKVRRYEYTGSLVDYEMNDHTINIMKLAEKDLHLYKSIYDPNQHKKSIEMEQLRISIVSFYYFLCCIYLYFSLIVLLPIRL